MQDKELKDLIVKSINGTLSDAEAATLYTWVQADAKHATLYVKIRDVYTLKQVSLANETPSAKAIGFKKNYRWMAAAGVVAIVSYSLFLWNSTKPASTLAFKESTKDQVILLAGDKTYTLSNDDTSSNMATLLDNVSVGSQDVQDEYTIIVPKGRTHALHLEDGSTVLLNAESRFTFPKHFKPNSRAVSLSGEGFFKVTKDAERPFSVHTAQGLVKVLGTQFNINAYQDIKAAVVSLFEGRVQVSNAKDQHILAPGQEASLERDQAISLRPFNTDEVFAWTEGLFIFDEKPLEEVLNSLQKWYHIEFSYADPNLKSLPIYLKMKKERDLDDLLKALEQTNRIRFTKNGNTIQVSP